MKILEEAETADVQDGTKYLMCVYVDIEALFDVICKSVKNENLSSCLIARNC